MQIWTRSLKSMYRREPILSCVVIAGGVNVAIGGLSEHWALMSVGLSVVGVAIALGVRQMYTRHRPIQSQSRLSTYVLPPARDSSLPMLTMSKKAPPRR